MPRRKTDTQFKQEIKDLVGDEYTFLEHYINNKTKLRVKHSKCDNIYKVSPNSFLRGSRCPYCNGGVKKTNAEFQQEIFELVGNEYTFLDTYTNSKTKIKVRHNKCGHTYEVVPSSFIQGSRCPYCNGGVKKTNAEFQQEIFELVGNEYTFLDAYRGNRFKIKVKHNKCGYTYTVAPYSFIQGKRCPYCFGTPKKTNIQFQQEVFNLVGDEYTFLDPYQGAHTKIKVKHNICGQTYEVRPSDFIYKYSRCPYCNTPNGEGIINKILKSLRIKYDYQKTFDDLIDTQLLSYDFFISGQSILIEYQGIQHYEPVDYFGGESKFKLQQKHDKMKSDYAKKHNYNLIAVPYTEDTFSKIKKYLLKHGLKK